MPPLLRDIHILEERAPLPGCWVSTVILCAPGIIAHHVCIDRLKARYGDLKLFAPWCYADQSECTCFPKGGPGAIGRIHVRYKRGY